MHKRFYTLLFYTLLCVLFTLTALSQDKLLFTPYTVNQGLAQSSIDDIIQDKDGFLWIGTAGGLCRFDGYRFKLYQPDAKDPSTIISDRGFHFYNDKNGQLWIISYNGISIYNPVKDNFDNLLFYEPRNVVTIENHIYGEDENDVWVGLCNYGLVKVNKKTRKVHRVNIPAISQRKALRGHYKGFWENGKLWIANTNQFNDKVFFIYDTRSRKTDTIPIPLTNIININDTLAVGINIKEALLINKKNFRYQPIPVTSDGSEPNVINLYKLPTDEVLICSTTKGLFYLNTQTRKITRHIYSADPGNTKQFLNARCAYSDWSGNLWIGTSDMGIQKLTYPFKKFKHYISYNSKTNNVFSIYADSLSLYAGCPSKGIDVFSKEKGFSGNITVNKQLTNITNSAFVGVPLNKDRLLMMGYSATSGGNHISLTYSTGTGRFQLLDAAVQQLISSVWGQGNLRQFMFRHTDDSVLFNIGENIIALTPDGGEKQKAAVMHRFPGETLSCCYKDHKGNLWIGTYTGAYYRKNGSWKKQSLPEVTEIKTICGDRDGNIWMGTADEIYVINPAHRVVRKYTEKDGLSNAHVYGILRDDTGNMWFSHNKGLTVYHRRTKKFRNYGVDDGLQSAEFNASAYFKAADGELFFGGINGITSFYPQQVLHNPHTPAVKITGIEVSEKPYQTDSSAWNIHSLVLPYTDNSVSFEFAMPEFTDPLKNRYTYIMEGVDRNWINAGDKRFARYAGLSPGHYAFKVKAFNNDGIETNEPSVIDIIIIPPFWQTTWFIVVCIVLATIAVIGLGVFIQQQRQKRQIRALELKHKIQLERERISRDLHDNVGTQLSLISKNIEGMLHPTKAFSESDKTHNLTAISQTSKEVMFTLRETIWALNKEDISLEEFSDKLKGFTQKLFEIHAGTELLYTGDNGSDSVLLSPSEAIHLFRICQEAIANSLKYAQATNMEISISSAGGKYEITVKDDGIGFEQASVGKVGHYGLENMQYRAADIGCGFAIHAAPGQGTSITISKK